MSSQARTRASEEERRLNMRTLVIASLASASAAVLTSQFWVAGTWMAAAVTPVIVALVSEMLHRPTAAIAERVTSRGTPVVGEERSGDVLPEAAGGGAPPRRRQEDLPERAPADPGSGPEAARPAAPVRVYRSGGAQRRGGRPAQRAASRGAKPSRAATPRNRRRIAIGAVAATAVLAFTITAVAITGTELVTGGSIGKGDRDTTLFGGRDRAEPSEDAPSDSTDQPSDGGQDQPDRPDQPDSQPKEEPQPEQPPADEPAPPQAPQTPVPEQP